jgi:hypothetical protein
MSINVEFKSISSGKCRWCKKDKDEVIELAFSDGSFVGGYCFADFKKALLDKLESNAPTTASKPQNAPAAVPVAGNGPAAK